MTYTGKIYSVWLALVGMLLLNCGLPFFASRRCFPSYWLTCATYGSSGGAKKLCDSLSLITFTFTLQESGGGSLRSSLLTPARLQVLLRWAVMTGLPKGSSAFARRGLMNSKPGWLLHNLHNVSGWVMETRVDPIVYRSPYLFWFAAFISFLKVLLWITVDLKIVVLCWDLSWI